ncbi:MULTISPECIES: hypothetical protein [unclassified Kitasatospora]|uniref:hypothetical protein n=1 Tax=unclassified Kitasatospora TaxID=2633591 RepID=UPI000ACC7A31|nr:hypothetical protein [Kitasatospora sp. MY 5-36]
MTVHVCHSTIEAIKARVESSNGAVMISNATVRALEEKERLRVERLQRVFTLLRARGLECYPQVPLYANEWWSFLVYRRDLLTVNLRTASADSTTRAALICAIDALSKPYWHEQAPSSWDLHKALRKLGAASVDPPRRSERHLSVA